MVKIATLIVAKYTIVQLNKNDMEDKFNCDECEIEFSLGDDGFIGSLKDYEVETLSTEDKHLRERLREIGFYPLLSIVELCKDCYTKTKKDKDNFYHIN